MSLKTEAILCYFTKAHKQSLNNTYWSYNPVIIYSSVCSQEPLTIQIWTFQGKFTVEQMHFNCECLFITKLGSLTLK